MKRTVFATIIFFMFLMLCGCNSNTSAPLIDPDVDPLDQYGEVIFNYYDIYYYDASFPSTLAYINEHSDRPAHYLKYYISVWGDLQEYHGDGLVFTTLTQKEKRLVKYPQIGSYVYLSSSEAEVFHSTKYCYTLLGISPIAVSSGLRHNYEPCSKCVGE